MAKPSEEYDWATDANYDATGTGWDTEPTKVAPASGLRDEGFEPSTLLAAEWLNYLLNAIGKWIGYFDARFTSGGVPKYDGLQTLTRAYQPQQGTLGVTSAGVVQWFQPSATSGRIESRVNSANWWMPLHKLIGDSAFTSDTIDVIEVQVDPGATLTARGGAGNGFSVGLYKATLSGSTWTWAIVGSLVDQDDSAALHTITLTPAHTIDNVALYAIRCVAGNDAGTNTDVFHGGRLVYSTGAVIR